MENIIESIEPINPIKPIETIILKTPHSLLSIRQFSKTLLLENCVNDVVPLLQHHPPIIIYGKKCKQNRNVGFFSDTVPYYYYSGKKHDSLQCTDNLRELIITINNIYGAKYNGILVNEYLNGKDYIGAHSDNESELDINAGVVALSWGAQRKFRIHTKKENIKLLDLLTTHGQLLQMSGDFQKEFVHSIPIESTVKEKRISFTFRRHAENNDLID